MKSNLTSIQVLGFALFFITLFVYIFSPNTGNDLEAIFLINYAIAAFFFLASLGDIEKQSKIYKLKIPKLNWHILISILTVSCFSFNKGIHIFSSIPIWLEIFLLISLICYIIIAISFKLPATISRIASAISGIALVVYFYYTIAFYHSRKLKINRSSILLNSIQPLKKN